MPTRDVAMSTRELAKYFPIRGTTSDEGGMLLMKINMNTVIPRRMVIVSDTRSPDSGGNLKVEKFSLLACHRNRLLSKHTEGLWGNQC